ncbi:MAG: ABC transporter permease, partial [Lachnospiraceae bacterium]|nr:ABC transporter permease [Lachnospiraceae bacterium]
MSNLKRQLLAGPYLVWIVGFIILPLAMILYYAFFNQNGVFTLEYISQITSPVNMKAMLLSLELGIACTVICVLLAYPLAMIL